MTINPKTSGAMKRALALLDLPTARIEQMLHAGTATPLNALEYANLMHARGVLERVLLLGESMTPRWNGVPQDALPDVPLRDDVQ
jgi:hypothetical protein